MSGPDERDLDATDPGDGPGTAPDGAADATGIDALDTLAAEYVLGSLDAEQRALFERLLERDEVLVTLVVDWEARLQGLADGVERQAPSEAFAERVREAVRSADAASGSAGAEGPVRIAGASAGPAANRSSVPSDRPVVAREPDIDLGLEPRAGPTAAEPARTPAPAPRTVVRTREVAAPDAGWHAGAIAASVIAAALLALLAGGFAGLQGPTDRTAALAADAPPAALGVLRDADGRARYLVEIDGAESGVRVTALDVEPVPADASLQLWTIDEASGEPRAVGLLPAGPWSSRRLGLASPVDGAPALAVSEEPPGGSLEPGPTGEIVLQGTVHELGSAD